MFTGSTSGLNRVHNSDQLMQVNEDQQVKKIRDVKIRGLLDPYEAALSTPLSSWERETWMGRIDQVLGEESGEKPISEINRLFCFLFAVAIDPEIGVEEKKAIIAEVQKPLEKDQLKDFYYTFTDTTSVMSTTILRYCARDVWEGSCRLVLKYRSVNIYEESFIHWIEGTINSQWQLEEKQALLDKIFDVLPTETGNDVLYYFMLHSSEDLQKLLIESCSPMLAKRVEGLKDKVAQFGQTTLSELKSKAKRVIVDFCDNQRQYFLEWFCKNALHHEDASLIAAGFDKKDWEWLQNRMKKDGDIQSRLQYHYSPWRRSPSPLIPLAMKWMIDVANRLKTEELAQDSTLRQHDAGLWLFFHYASSIIEKEKGWGDISNEDYQKITGALTVENLFNFLGAFQGDLRNRIIKNIMHDEPQKLISWLYIILRIPENDLDQRTSEKISELFSLITKNGCLQTAIPIIFVKKQSDNILMLSTYSALDLEHRKDILKHILLDRKEGLKILTGWVELCLQDSGRLKSYVKDAFAKNIYALLQEMDPTVTTELKKILDQAPFVQSSQENQEFVNFILPVGVDLSDPAVRQEEAIKKLKRHFLTPGVPIRGRDNFVSSVRKDLKAEEETSVWLPKLFDKLPKQTWPLIFLCFERDVYEGFNFDSFEEKSRGGVHKEAKKGSPTPPNCLPNLERWVELAAQTLSQMIDNPCLQCKDNYSNSQTGWAMQRFYRATCKSKTVHAVIQKFIEIAPPELFIPTMDKLALSCFFNNIDGFKELILTALNNVNVEKTPFIAKCMMAQQQRKMEDTSRALVIGPIELEKELWEEPYLKNHEERSYIAKILIRAMGIQFLSYFNRSSVPTKRIIESLKITDQTYVEQVFCVWINSLCAANNSEDFKFKIFQNICYSYFRADIDVMKLLKSEISEESLSIIQKWYSSDDLIDHHLHMTSKLGLTFLRFYNEQGFYPAVFRKIKAIVTDKRNVSFYELNELLKALEKLGCMDEFVRQLFGQQQEVVKSMKVCFENDLVECFSSYHSFQSIPLVCKMIPDWKERLIVWMKDQIQKDKEESKQYGSKPSYDQVVNVFNSLDKAEMLDGFMASLKSDASEEFARDLNDAYEKFTKDLQKN